MQFWKGVDVERAVRNRLDYGFVEPGPSRENIDARLGGITYVFAHGTRKLNGDKVDHTLKFGSESGVYFKND
jgi:hypothetical protein